jgi:hypothetical protein
MRNESSDWKLQADVFSENLGPMGTQGGPIRLGMESAAGFFCQLEATAGSDGGRRIFHQLDKFEGLCLSPIQHDIQIFDQNQEGSSRPDSCGTGLASATVVPSNNGTSMSTSSGHSPGVDNAFGSAGQLPPSSSSGITPVSRLVIIRDRFKARGFSDHKWSSFSWEEP